MSKDGDISKFNPEPEYEVLTIDSLDVAKRGLLVQVFIGKRFLSGLVNGGSSSCGSEFSSNQNDGNGKFGGKCDYVM
jgi:hypothetical protein